MDYHLFWLFKHLLVFLCVLLVRRARTNRTFSHGASLGPPLEQSCAAAVADDVATNVEHDNLRFAVEGGGIAGAYLRWMARWGTLQGGALGRQPSEPHQEFLQEQAFSLCRAIGDERSAQEELDVSGFGH